MFSASVGFVEAKGCFDNRVGMAESMSDEEAMDGNTEDEEAVVGLLLLDDKSAAPGCIRSIVPEWSIAGTPELEGATDGFSLGLEDGSLDGLPVGATVGIVEGTLLGVALGRPLGPALGAIEGVPLGSVEGVIEGTLLGSRVVGNALGLADG